MAPDGEKGDGAGRSSLAEAILEASADGVVLVDEDGVILTANAAAERLLSRGPGTIVGETLGVPSAHADDPRGAEIQVLCPGGGVRTVELRTALTRWEGRGVTVVTLRDVTDRLRTLEELRNSQELLAQIAENAEGVFFMSTVEGKLLYVSPGLSRFAPDVEVVPGKDLRFEMVHPEDREKMKELLSDPDRAPYEVEYRMTPRPGDVKWVRQRGFPVKDAEGRTYRVAGWIEDVTERRESLERLEDAQRVLSRTVASLDEGVLTLDLTGNDRTIVDVNPAAERMFGYSRDELIGRTTEFLLEDREAYERMGQEVRRAIEEEGVFRSSAPIRRRDGALFAAELTLSLLDPGGGPQGLCVGVVRDVSAEKRAEEELRASEERFREIAEHIGDVFWISPPDGRGVTYVSPSYERIWGRDPEEILEDSGSWLETILPSDRKRVRETMSRQSEGGWEEEYRIVRPDGEVRWVWDRAFPVMGPDGNVRRIIGVAEDVTERKQAEERFGVLSQEITDIIFVVGADGVIRSVSPSAQSLGGFRQEDIDGESSLSWVYPEDREAVKESLDHIVSQPGAVARVQHRVLTEDGEVRHMESVARNRLDHPAIAGIIFTSRDITERLRLENQLRQSQKMEAVGQLAGGIAHDFNNLLTVIRSQTDLLLMDLDEGSPLREEVESIQTSAGRAARLTSQLLAFSRDQVLRPRLVDLNDVVRGMRDLLTRIIGEDIRIAHELTPGLPPIRIDPGQMEQVVMNLAVNARDAMPRGGTLTLTTALEELDDEEAAALPGLTPGRSVVLWVADTGTGMDEKTRQRIFEPFFTTKGTGKGTGLGLSMAYGFVKQSGGAIHADSVPGEGTTVTLRFPAAEGRVETEDETEEQERFIGVDVAGTVLVVEDDRDVRRVTARILDRAGITVETAEDAETGLERLRAGESIALLLTDLILPGMSGRALIEEVHTTHPELQVVVMSGYAEESPGDRGDLPEEIAFIQKPFSPDELLDVVRRALGLA